MRLDQWIPSLVSAVLVVGALGSFALANEGRISSLESKMSAMESGRSTPMADSTRERFDALAHQLDSLDAGIGRLELRLDSHSERVSRIEGKLFPEKRSGVALPKPPITPTRGAASREQGG